MKKFLLLILSLLSALCASATDYVSIVATGNWNDMASWAPNGVPGAADNVTISNGHTITLTGAEACNNLTLNGISGTRLVCGNHKLDINGTLTGPGGTFSDNIITSTSAVGRIKFVGSSSRDLFASWGAFGTGYDIEVALTGGATGTLGGAFNIKVRNAYITSGTLDMSSNQLRIDGGSNGAGILQVSAGAVLKANRVGERTSSAGTYCGTVTIDGEVEIHGSFLSGNTVTINGTLRLKSANSLLSNPSGQIDPEFVYGPAGVLEYNCTSTSSTQSMGAEVGRAGTTADPIITTMRINRGLGEKVSTNFRAPVVENLEFLGGKLEANSNIIVVSGGSVTGESADSYVITTTGGLVRNSVGAVDTDFPVGTAAQYLPVLLNNSGTADNFTVKATSSTTPPLCLSAAPNMASSAIQAAWDIAESVAGGSDCTITLDYQDVALRGSTYDPNTAKVVRCSGTFATHAFGGPDVGTSVTGSGFTAFSPFGIGSSTVLPLQLGAFRGLARPGSNLLLWQTLTERNTDRFAVERGSDALRFAPIGTVRAAGNAHDLRDYTFDDSKPLPGKNYYRLRIMDLDGTTTYSPVIELDCRDCSGGLRLYPVPSSGTVFLALDRPSHEEETWTFTLTDVAGRTLRTAALDAPTEGAWRLDFSGEKPGTYFVTLTNGAERWVRRVVRE